LEEIKMFFNLYRLVAIIEAFWTKAFHIIQPPYCLSTWATWLWLQGAVIS
jgi:hypothetical protein